MSASWKFLSLQLLLIYTGELFSILENQLYGYADDSTFEAVRCRAIPLRESSCYRVPE